MCKVQPHKYLPALGQYLASSVHHLVQKQKQLCRIALNTQHLSDTPLLCCSSCGLRIKNALLWTLAMAVVLGLAIGVAYGELQLQLQLHSKER